MMKRLRSTILCLGLSAMLAPAATAASGPFDPAAAQAASEGETTYYLIVDAWHGCCFWGWSVGARVIVFEETNGFPGLQMGGRYLPDGEWLPPDLRIEDRGESVGCSGGCMFNPLPNVHERRVFTVTVPAVPPG